MNSDNTICKELVSSFFKTLNNVAEFSDDKAKPLGWYLRSIDQLYKQAIIYKRENNLEKSYVLFLRFANLAVKIISSNEGTNQKTLNTLRSLCDNALDNIETLKTEIISKIEREFQKANEQGQSDNNIIISKDHSKDNLLPTKNESQIVLEPISLSKKWVNEKGIELRDLFLPSQIISVFLEIAFQNTVKNLETCGLISGTLVYINYFKSFI